MELRKDKKKGKGQAVLGVLGSWDAGMLGAGWKVKRELRKEKKKGKGKAVLGCWDAGCWDAGCWDAGWK